jgi:hypothetical protein
MELAEILLAIDQFNSFRILELTAKWYKSKLWGTAAARPFCLSSATLDRSGRTPRSHHRGSHIGESPSFPHNFFIQIEAPLIETVCQSALDA